MSSYRALAMTSDKNGPWWVLKLEGRRQRVIVKDVPAAEAREKADELNHRK